MVKDSSDNDYDERYDSYTIFNSYKTHLVLLLFFVLFVFIVVFSFLGNQPMMESAKPWMFAIEIILWVILILIIVLNVKTIKSGDIDFTQQLINLFGYNDPEVSINVHTDDTQTKGSVVQSTSQELKKEEVKKDTTHKDQCIDKSKEYWFKNSEVENPNPDYEVFHIPQNIYNYDDAEKTCKILKSRLATYDEVERAYQNGGSWCSYGWSSDQLALFPTQREIYNELKNIPGHERDCGRPGINGGYIKDKNMKFGINCYGKKPYITDRDKEYIKQHNYSAAFKKKSQEKEKEIEKQINTILVAPFNKNRWSDL